MRRLRTEREGVRVADDLRDGERDDVADHALLRRRARRHAGQVDRVLARSEIDREVLRGLVARGVLEVDVGVLLRRRRHRVHVPERRREDDLVAVTDKAVDHLRGLWPLRDALLERGDDILAELLLDVEASEVVGLRPAAVVVRPDVDPRCLDRRCRRGRARRGRRGRDERCERDDPDRRPERLLPLPHVRTLLRVRPVRGGHSPPSG